MVNEQKARLPEILKCPYRFWHFVTSPFCEGESQTYKIAINGSIYSTNIHIRLCLYHQAEGACSEPRIHRYSSTVVVILVSYHIDM